jgi:hypothetical protein
MIPGSALGASLMTLSTTTLNASSVAPGGVFGYEGVPGASSMLYSLAPAPGTDQFGNTYPTGLVVNAGQLSGVNLTGIAVDATSVLQGSLINSGVLSTPFISGGTATSTVHVLNSSGGAVLSYTNAGSVATFSSNGTFPWTCPTNVTQALVECWGAGGGGGGGSGSEGGEGGGGGEYAAESTLTVVPGQVYQVQVGNGGVGGNTNNPGDSGGDSIFADSGGNNLVYAAGGQAGLNFQGGSAGVGSTNTVEEPGGTGASASGNSGGNGGGSSGGQVAPGNIGNQSAGSTGGTGGGAPTGGGAGGAGGNNAANGVGGSSPGGAGGGAGQSAGLGSLTNIYYPTGSISYFGAQHVPPNVFRSVNSSVYHGSNGQGGNSGTGDQYGFVLYNYRQMRSDLAGATINSIYLHLDNLGTGQGSGMTVAIGYTTFTGTFGTTFIPGAGTHEAQSTFHVTQNSSTTYNITSWMTSHITSDFTAIILGSASSFTNPGNIVAYGLFYGYSSSNNGNTPYLKVNYTPAGNVTQTAGSGADGQVKITYNGSNALVGAIAPTGGTDVFGNPYNPGSTTVQHTFLTQGSLPAGSSLGGIIASDVNSTPNVVQTSGQAGAITTSQSDLSTPSLGNSTVATNLSVGWVINANDLNSGTEYVISMPFTGTMGAATQTLNIGYILNGTFHNLAPVDNLTLAHGVVGHVNMHFKCTGAGAGGTFQAWSEGTITDASQNRLASTSWNPVGLTTGQAINTIVANTVSIGARFGATSTGETITGQGSTFIRYGS